MADYFYDGHEAISGVSGANPTVIPRNFCSVSVNRSFRFDENRTRPGLISLQLEFPDDDRKGNDRKLFEAGNCQGGTFYNAYPSYRPSLLVFSIAGSIFTVEVRGNVGYVRRLISGNYPQFLHAWFAQAFEWLVIQDGGSKPILWNGLDAPRRAGEEEVPIGSVMASIHGRLVVASSDGTNQIAVGDIVYGRETTNTNDVIRFTETEYWAEGGAFGVPAFISDIMFMVPMPFLDTGNGQNELVVVGKDGAIALDLSGPRETWKDTRVQRVSQIGGGGISSHGYCLLNADLIYRSTEGVRSYRNSRSEYQQTWQQTPISTDVRRWMGSNAGRYGQFCPMVSWNNQVLVGVSPLIAKPNTMEAGFHHYHRGFVVLDAQPQSNTLRSGASIWQGLYTGIRPVSFVQGRIQDVNRCFALSYDQDGKNRIYEMTTNLRDDWFEGDKKKIVSFYDTGILGTSQQSSNFDLKMLNGGQIQVSNLSESVNLSVSYRPESTPCFLPLYSQTLGCDCPDYSDNKNCFTSDIPQRDKRFFPSAPATCAPGSTRPGNQMNSMQARVKVEGSVTVDRMAFKFTPKGQDESVNCAPSTCKPAICCPYEEEYAYQLASPGVNTEIPIVPPPDGVPVVYEATATAIATCPDGTTSTGYGTATSTISYEDALAKAKAAAEANAQENLNCGNPCSGCHNTGFKALFHGNDYDMSAFFNSGAWPTFNGQAWRVIDTDSNIYASGIVSGGTLVTLSFDGSGDIIWNDTTKTVENNSASVDIYVGLQLACQGEFCELPEPCLCEPELYESISVPGSGGSLPIAIFGDAPLGATYFNRPFRVREITLGPLDLVNGTIDGTGNLVVDSVVGPGAYMVYVVVPDVFNDFLGNVTVVTEIGCVCGEQTIWPE